MAYFVQESVIFKEMGETHVGRSTWKIAYVGNLDTLKSTPCRADVYSRSYFRVEVVGIFSYQGSATKVGCKLPCHCPSGREGASSSRIGFRMKET